MGIEASKREKEPKRGESKLNVSHNRLASLDTVVRKFNEEVRELRLMMNDVTYLPKEIEYLKGLEVLDASGNKLEFLPVEIKYLVNLNQLILAINRLNSICPEIQYLTSLTLLDLQNNALQQVPEVFDSFVHMTRLDMSGNLLRSLPALFSRNLAVLRLGRNQLSTLPATLSHATALQELELQHNFITELPSSFEFHRLSKLVLACNQLKSLPLAVFDCRQLTHLDLSKNYLTNISEAISQLTNLRYLNASYNLIKGLPAGVGQLSFLHELVLDHNRLASVHPNIGKLELLSKLPLFNNCLQQLPDEFCQLTRLDEINLAFNRLKSLPADFGQLTHLERIFLDGNQLEALPEFPHRLNRLQGISMSANRLHDKSFPASFWTAFEIIGELRLFGNEFTQLPKEISQLTRLRKFSAGFNQLTAMPSSLTSLTSLVAVHVSNNKFSAIPAEFASLRNLEELNICGNNITSMPAWITDLSKLHYLDLGFNKILDLPADIGTMMSLDELCLNGNQLTHVPAEISQLHSMRYLDLSFNRLLTNLPKSLFECSSLRHMKLSFCGLRELPSVSYLFDLRWVSLAGNQLARAPSAALADVTEVPTKRLRKSLSEPAGKLPKFPNRSQSNKGDNMEVEPTSLNMSEPHPGVLQGNRSTGNLDSKIDKKKHRTPKSDRVERKKHKKNKKSKSTNESSKSITTESSEKGNNNNVPVNTNVNNTNVNNAPKNKGSKRVKKIVLTRNLSAGKSGGNASAFVEPGIDNSPATTPRTDTSDAVEEEFVVDPPPPQSPRTVVQYRPIENVTKRKKNKAKKKLKFEVSVSEMKGFRPTMEDTVLMMDHFYTDSDYTFHLFAVFDGHSDSNAAEFCANNYHRLLEKYLKNPLEDSTFSDSELFGSDLGPPGNRASASSIGSSEGPRSGTKSTAESDEGTEQKNIDYYDYYEGYDDERLVNKNDEYSKQIKRALFHSFEQASNQVLEKGYRSGCTACVVLIQQYIGAGKESNYVWFANCGDARAVSYGGDTAVRQTRDHKPLQRSERIRVQYLGGVVSDNGRIQTSTGQNIAVARAVGDSPYQPYVSYAPFINQIRLTDEQFIVLACDGLWDVIDDQRAAELVLKDKQLQGGY
eukprot:TRINITY_DN960_c0_g3_i1.p1 TRINITY_DN960_c0_g3~~TRINITY_DN960_c0_g3_i1.p1  ORF type:complete len:1113 (+),score=313.34 TRINITY_DN960_c0_g3_i1:86-3424(+)